MKIISKSYKSSTKPHQLGPSHCYLKVRFLSRQNGVMKRKGIMEQDTLKFLFRDCIYLFLERREGKEKERKRDINV